jgi:hypothetical protein
VPLAQDTIGEGQFLLKTGQPLEVTVVAPDRPPRRTSPIIALFDKRDTQVLIFSVDGADLVVLHRMKAIPLKLDEVDLRWRHALDRIAPQDTFVVQTWRGEYGVCFAVNSTRRCGFGYTIGDGWKLIFYPEHFPAWLYLALNISWMAGWTVGVGWWAGKRETGNGKRNTRSNVAIDAASTAIVLIGLIVVPMLTGLKPTPILEWIGAIGGLGLGTYFTRRFSTSPAT